MLKIKYIQKAAFIFLIVSLTALTLKAQQSDSLPKDTLVLLGGKPVKAREIEMTKKAFLKTGKIDVNQKGCTVDQYSYSMFALGSNIRATVRDSLIPEKLKRAILNKHINYRYINIDGIIIRNGDDNLFIPEIDTIKVKFVYQ